jgi:hypothetical protein
LTAHIAVNDGLEPDRAEPPPSMPPCARRGHAGGTGGAGGFVAGFAAGANVNGGWVVRLEANAFQIRCTADWVRPAIERMVTSALRNAPISAPCTAP